jgi:hypothetical protein
MRLTHKSIYGDYSIAYVRDEPKRPIGTLRDTDGTAAGEVAVLGNPCVQDSGSAKPAVLDAETPAYG